MASILQSHLRDLNYGISKKPKTLEKRIRHLEVRINHLRASITKVYNCVYGRNYRGRDKNIKRLLSKLKRYEDKNYGKMLQRIGKAFKSKKRLMYLTDNEYVKLKLWLLRDQRKLRRGK